MADLINITREAVFKEFAKLVACIGKPGPLSYSVPSLINESENNLCPIQVESSNMESLFVLIASMSSTVTCNSCDKEPPSKPS